MLKTSVIIIFVILLVFSCTTTGGGNWWLVDFDKYDKNYRSLDQFINKIYLGMRECLLKETVGDYIKLVEANSEYTTLAIEQWESAVGNDFIVRILYIKIVDQKIDSFIIKEISNKRVTIPIFIWT